MYEGNSGKLFVRYALPQMVGLLFNSIYLIVDGVFIGNCLGRDAMAAAAVSVPLVEILISLAMAVESGAGIIISGCIGRKENDKAVECFNLSVLITGITGMIIAVLCNIFINPLVGLLGATPSVRSEAVTYMRYIVSFAPFLLFSFLFGGLARNDGCPKLAMIALSVGSVSNIILDYVFMYPMNMGIAGAALATGLGPIFSVLILLPHFLLCRGVLHFAKTAFSFAKFRSMLKLGVPSFVMEFTIGIVTFIYNIAITTNRYGELRLAAYLILGYLMLLILTLFLGMAEGLQPVFSYFSGTGEGDRNRALRIFTSIIFLVVGLVVYILVFLFSDSFYAMFVPMDGELIDFAYRHSIVYFSCFFIAGFNILMISFWQSTQCTWKSLLISLLRSVILLPVLILVLPHMFGSEAIWICHSVTEFLTAGTAAAILYKKE